MSSLLSICICLFSDIIRKEHRRAEGTQLDMRRPNRRRRILLLGLYPASSPAAEVGVVIKNLKSAPNVYTHIEELGFCIKEKKEGRAGGRASPTLFRRCQWNFHLLIFAGSFIKEMLSGQTGGALASRWTCVHTKKKLFFFLLLFFNLFHHFLRLVLSPLFNHEINYSFPRYANNKKIWEKMKKLMMMMMLDIFKMTRASFILLCRVSYFRKELHQPRTHP